MPHCSRIAVLGGANLDIGGFADPPLRLGDSLPGRVRLSPGGVGRNVAENAARLGLQVRLLTALGDDPFGRWLLDDCRERGIDVRGSRIVPGGHTSVYLYVGDPEGEMLCAVNDMAIQAELTPAFLAPALPELNRRDAVVLDANLPAETIIRLARELRVPLFAAAVSAAKVERLRPVLPRLQGLQLNRVEAERLTGDAIASPEDACRAARQLHEQGVQRVLLTLGGEGAVGVGEEGSVFLPCRATSKVNATGAGDACLATMLWAHCEDLDLLHTTRAAMAAAALTVASAETVSPGLCPSALRAALAAGDPFP